jgi:hypothetical protein
MKMEEIKKQRLKEAELLRLRDEILTSEVEDHLKRNKMPAVSQRFLRDIKEAYALLADRYLVYLDPDTEESPTNEELYRYNNELWQQLQIYQREMVLIKRVVTEQQAEIQDLKKKVKTPRKKPVQKQ